MAKAPKTTRPTKASQLRQAQAYLRARIEDHQDAEATVYALSRKLLNPSDITQPRWMQRNATQKQLWFALADTENDRTASDVKAHLATRSGPQSAKRRPRRSETDPLLTGVSRLRLAQWCDIEQFDLWRDAWIDEFVHDERLWNAIPFERAKVVLALCRSATGQHLFDPANVPAAPDEYWIALSELLDCWTYETWICGEAPLIPAAMLTAVCLANSKHVAKNALEKMAKSLLDSQFEGGAWPLVRGVGKVSTMTTAAAVHALAISKPPGWKESIAKAADWLWQQQEQAGYWTDFACRNRTWLGVLVLDAIDLATGKEALTFDIRPCTQSREPLSFSAYLYESQDSRDTDRQHARKSSPEESDSSSGNVHSDDFRVVRWFGTTYYLTASQARIVSILWKNWERGTPDVGDTTLLEAARCETNRLRDIFGRSKAWNTLIVRGKTGGSHRLVDPMRHPSADDDSSID